MIIIFEEKIIILEKMSKGIYKNKETIEIIKNCTESEDSELDSSKSQSNLSNINIEDSLPLPNNKNLLDNYDIIQYKNVKFPRLKTLEISEFYQYKKPFTDVFVKINQDFLLTKLFFTQIFLSHKNQNKEEKNTSNNNIKKINEASTASKKHKHIKRIFNLKLYDNNKNLINRKRGRISLKKISHIHSALDDDNILRKIQVHFLTFLVSFTNDYIDALFPNMDKKNILHFRHIDYKLKKTINHNSVEGIKALNIGEILKKDASPKNKTCQSNINEIIYNKLCEKCPSLRFNYFNKLFKEFFIEYYYNKNERFIIINGVKVILSKKTQTFNALIQKNIKFSSKFRHIASYFYINSAKNERNNEKNKEDEGVNKDNNLEKEIFFVINK